MAQPSENAAQIRQAHAGLIHRVVIGAQNPQLVLDLEELLTTAEQNGWSALVEAIREILAGRRDTSLLDALDEEDSVIVGAILDGLQDRTSLPAFEPNLDPSLAAPGVASLVHAARTGSAEAMQLVATITPQMVNSGGDTALLAGAIRPLVLGERDPKVLSEGMSRAGEKLVAQILDELSKLEAG